MRQASPVRGQPVGLFPVLVVLRGTGAAAPSVETGPHGTPAVASATSGLSGVTTVRNAAGDVTLTFSEKPGQLLLMTAGHGIAAPSATTPRAVDLDNDSMTTTGNSVRIFISTPATDAVAAAASDLGATETLGLVFWFRVTGVNPV